MTLITDGSYYLPTNPCTTDLSEIVIKHFYYPYQARTSIPLIYTAPPWTLLRLDFQRTNAPRNEVIANTKNLRPQFIAPATPVADCASTSSQPVTFSAIVLSLARRQSTEQGHWCTPLGGCSPRTRNPIVLGSQYCNHSSSKWYLVIRVSCGYYYPQ